MPSVTLPFDPLSYLEGYMRLRVDLDPKGKIILRGLGRLEPRHAKRALWVRDTYDRLLRMQLDAPKREMRPSVRKLLAQVRIVIRGGKYVLP
ncbi:MAG: hypothetical protein ACLFPG_11380 [Desulfohalobiaceae bacterium]